MYGEEPLASNPFSTEAFQVSGRVFGIPHPSFLCRVKRALPFLLPQRLWKLLGRMARLKRVREENKISDQRPVAFSFLANRSNNVDPEPTPDPFMFLSLYDRTFFHN